MFVTLQEEERHRQTASAALRRFSEMYQAGWLDSSDTKVWLPQEIENLKQQDYQWKQLLNRCGLNLAAGEFGAVYAFNLELLCRAAQQLSQSSVLNSHYSPPVYLCSWFGVEDFRQDFNNLYSGTEVRYEPFADCFHLIEQIEKLLREGCKFFVIESLDWLTDLDEDFDFPALLRILNVRAHEAAAVIYLSATEDVLRQTKTGEIARALQI